MLVALTWPPMMLLLFTLESCRSLVELPCFWMPELFVFDSTSAASLCLPDVFSPRLRPVFCEPLGVEILTPLYWLALVVSALLSMTTSLASVAQ